MRARLRALLAAGLLVMLSPVLAAGPAAPLRVMSFNIRLPTDADGEDRWDQRKPLAARMLQQESPDLVGTQELHASQAEYLVGQLPGYAWLGRGRDDGSRSGEHVGVFYRQDRLQVIELGDFWLSDTPERAGSISWGHPYPRMVTWALFQRIDDGRRFYLFNTHLPYREGDDDARLRGARLLLQRLSALPPDVPVVLTGDFNTTPDSDVHALLATQLQDAWAHAPQLAGPEATFHGYSGHADRRIDWILVRGLQALEAHTVSTRWQGRYPSDHFPVVATLALPHAAPLQP